jgi:glucose-1-phosphate adenylyltransferase
MPEDPDHVLASMGNYVFSTEVFRDVMASDAMEVGSSHDVGGDIIPALVEQGVAHAYDYTTNVVPGEEGRPHYWRDVGTIDSYFAAQMDLVSSVPAFDLYNDRWPIFTRTMTEPPAKIANGPYGSSQVNDSILCSGAIVSGGVVHQSVISGDVVIDQARVEQCVLMEGVRVEPGADIRRCIIDKNVIVPSGTRIGHDHDADRERFEFVSDSGIVTIQKNQKL